MMILSYTHHRFDIFTRLRMLRAMRHAATYVFMRKMLLYAIIYADDAER